MSQKRGDPGFGITDPPGGGQVVTTFSVSGSCSAVTAPPPPTITVKVGSLDPVAAQYNALSKTWEAIISNAPVGLQSVTATCDPNGHNLQATSNVNVVDAGTEPVFTVDAPTPPPTDTRGTPFGGWSVGGTYDSTKVTRIRVYVTKKGVKVSADGTATLNSDGTWSCPFGDLSLTRAAGQGFCVQVAALTNDGQTTQGSIPAFLTAPGSDADE